MVHRYYIIIFIIQKDYQEKATVMMYMNCNHVQHISPYPSDAVNDTGNKHISILKKEQSKNTHSVHKGQSQPITCKAKNFIELEVISNIKFTTIGLCNQTSNFKG